MEPVGDESCLFTISIMAVFLLTDLLGIKHFPLLTRVNNFQKMSHL